MKVRLTRKYAECIDGIDLSEYEVGDIIDLSNPEAQLLMAEGWAAEERRAIVIPTPFHRRAEDRLPSVSGIWSG